MSAAFQTEYRPLAGWGEITLLPWDEAIFGFPVAELRPAAAPSAECLPEALRRFCERTGAELISARAAGADTATQALLSAAGFIPVEFSLLAQIPRLIAARLPRPRLTLRRAEPADREAILRIAGSAFAFGRYHGDPRFPRELANRRYVRWVETALDGVPDDYVFAAGPAGAPIGFMDAVIRDGRADLRLGAVDPAGELGFAGVALYTETLREAAAMGAASVSARIAAANTRVLNLCAMLGFQFSGPELIFHWHAPRAAHLLPAAAPEGGA
jgi:hypothetical protein